MNEAAHACRAGAAKRGGARFHLAVLGAGSAGFAAAIHAAEQGARVALVGQGTLGGTCVNVGCVPSKTLIRVAEALHQAGAAARFAGIRGEAHLESWAAAVAQKDELVAGLRQARYAELLPAYDNIAYLEGPARLASGGIAINGESVYADKAVITTGARPDVSLIPGLDELPYLTSTTALALEQLPRSLLVIGGGYVGCELAQMFARAGVGVSIVCRRRLLPAAEPEIGRALAGYFRDEGITVREGVAYRRICATSDGIALAIDEQQGEKTVEAERVLVATGRRPNTDGLGLAEAVVALGENGGIRVDEHLRSTNPDVYAAGDVTGRDMFVYMAAYGAKVAADNALNGNTRRYDTTGMPAVVFTDPQAASVGLTEAQAAESGLEVESRVLSLEHVPRALAARDTRGLIKLVAEAGTGRLLGAHVLAPEGCDSIQTAVLAIRHGLTVSDLAETIFPYLTTVEGLKLAAQSFAKDVSRLSCCAG